MSSVALFMPKMWKRNASNEILPSGIYAKCHKCSKTGHFGSMCLTKKHIGAVHDADGNDADWAFLGSIHDKKASDQWLMMLQLGNTKVKFLMKL